MSLVFTFLCATNHVKALTLDETLDFHTNLAGKKGTNTDYLDKAKKKDFTKNVFVKDRDQDLVSRIEGDKCTRGSEDIILSKLSISKSVRLL